MLTAARHGSSKPSATLFANDNLGSPHFVFVSETQFSLNPLSPGVESATRGDSRAVIDTGRDLNDGVTLIREMDQNRLCDDIRVDGRLERVVILWKTELAIGRATNGVDLAGMGQEQRVVSATLDLNDVIAVQFLWGQPLDLGWRLDHVILGAGVSGTGLAHTVQTPAPDGVVVVHGKRMESPCANDNSLATTSAEDDLLRYGSMDLASLDDLAPKLALLSRTPSVDIAMGGKDDNVVAARRYRGDLFPVSGFVRKRQDGHRGELVLQATGKAKRTLVDLIGR